MPRQARFFPELIHEKKRSNPSFRAELRFYDLLEQQLPSGWTVFYDVGWLSRRFDDDSLRDGQTDFVLRTQFMGFWSSRSRAVGSGSTAFGSNGSRPIRGE